MYVYASTQSKKGFSRVSYISRENARMREKIAKPPVFTGLRRIKYWKMAIFQFRDSINYSRQTSGWQFATCNHRSRPVEYVFPRWLYSNHFKVGGAPT